MQLSHLTIIAVKEGDKVFRQIALIFFVQRADNTAVDADILRIFRVLVADEYVARVHIGMKEAVAEHLGKEDLHAPLRQQLHVGPLGLQRLHVGHRDTVDALHHHHAFAAVVGVHLRHVQHRTIFEITPQLNGVGGFPQQVQLVQQRFFIFANHLLRAQTAAVRQQTRYPASQAVDELHVRFNDRQNIRADNLDHHLFAILFQTCGMHLGDGRRG